MGDGGSDGPSESGFDLFDRWLAHHDGRTTDGTAEEQPADPPPAAEMDPLFDESFPTDESEPTLEEPEFGLLIETQPPVDTQPPAEPVTPADFEPVIIPSARNRKPESRRSRLARRRDVETVAETGHPPEVEPDPVPEPDPDAGEVPDEPPTRAGHVGAGREVFAAFAAEDSPPTPPAPKAKRPRARPEPDAARVMLAASLAEREPAVAVPPVPTKTEAEPAAKAKKAPEQPPRDADAPAADRSTNVDFTPKTGARRLVGVLLLLALAAAAVAAYVAYDDRTTNNIGVAATLLVLTLVIWAVRAGSSSARLSVRSGQLEILGTEGRFVFDLRSRYTPIEVVGRPGERGWKVLFLRRSMAPFVVDASMVDPQEFMRVLRQHRPEHD